MWLNLTIIELSLASFYEEISLALKYVMVSIFIFRLFLTSESICIKSRRSYSTVAKLSQYIFFVILKSDYAVYWSKTGDDYNSSRKTDCPAGLGKKNNHHPNYSCINILHILSGMFSNSRQMVKHGPKEILFFCW